ncbi:MAG: hypothetical protein WC659_04725 [Patescibacteria group bacterium]
MLHAQTVTLERFTPTRATQRRAHGRTRTVSLPSAIGLLLGCISVGIAYLVSVSAQSTTGYALHTLEKNYIVLTDEVRTLERSIQELSSISVIETAARSMDLTSIDDPRYLTPDTGVAVGEGVQKP